MIISKIDFKRDLYLFLEYLIDFCFPDISAVFVTGVSESFFQLMLLSHDQFFHLGD